MKKYILATLLLFFSIPTISNAIEDSNYDFSFEKTQVVSCRPSINNNAGFISDPGTKVKILYKISDKHATWYRVLIDRVPGKNTSNNYGEYTIKQKETCSDSSKNSSLDLAPKLFYWVKENVIPENLRNSVKDYEFYAKGTLNEESFYVENYKMVTGDLKMCPDENCPVQWVGGTPSCSKGVKDSCGIATLIEKQEEWSKVVISNIDTDNFDVAGSDGWINNSKLPSFLNNNDKTEGAQPLSEDKNTDNSFNFSLNKKIITPVLSVLFLIIIFLILKNTKIRNYIINNKNFRKYFFIIMLLIILPIIFIIFYPNIKNNFFVEKKDNLIQNTEPSNIKNPEIENLKKEIEDLKKKGSESNQQPKVIQVPIKEKTNSEIIKEWRNHLVQIACTNDGENYSLGSGTITEFVEGAPVILTNSHVVSSDGKLYVACGFVMKDWPEAYILSKESYSFSPTEDVSYILTEDSSSLNPDIKVSDIGDIKICSGVASIGDKVIILGYPSAGGTDGAITATDGIISSYDGQYYVTSAKIDHGNSGGAAILVKDNCYLGIPTWAANGGFESFGRILSQSYFLGHEKPDVLR